MVEIVGRSPRLIAAMDLGSVLADHHHRQHLSSGLPKGSVLLIECVLFRCFEWRSRIHAGACIYEAAGSWPFVPEAEILRRFNGSRGFIRSVPECKDMATMLNTSVA